MANRNTIPESKQSEIISLFYHSDYSVGEICREFKWVYPEKEIAKILVNSNLGIERTIIVESIMNYTNRLRIYESKLNSDETAD